MIKANIIGYIATAVSSSMLIPQVFRTWRTKSSKDISLGMCLLGTLGASLWLVYGILVRAMPVMIANFLVLLCFLTLLIFKLKYK